MAKTRDITSKITVTARLEAALVETLDAIAASDRRSRSDVLSFAVEEYVERHSPKGDDKKAKK